MKTDHRATPATSKLGLHYLYRYRSGQEASREGMGLRGRLSSLCVKVMGGFASGFTILFISAEKFGRAISSCRHGARIPRQQR